MSAHPQLDMTGCVAIVTGASRGIGLGVVHELLTRGAAVIGVDLEPLPESVQESARFDHRQLTGVQGDLRQRATMKSALDAADRSRGELSILVHSVYAEERMPLLDVTAHGWQRSLDVMLTAVQQADVAFVRTLAGNAGSIVHVASQHAFGAVPGFAAYSAAKAGLLALTRSAAVEWGPLGIRCNAVAPGFIQVERNQSVWEDPERLESLLRSYPLRRPGTVEEVARAVLFLASNMASFTTGSCLGVDGGQTAALPEALVR